MAPSDTTAAPPTRSRLLAVLINWVPSLLFNVALPIVTYGKRRARDAQARTPGGATPADQPA